MEEPKPKFAEEGKLKTQLTEADLDASLEMLYFMWIAAGRPQVPLARTMVTVADLPVVPKR